MFEAYINYWKGYIDFKGKTSVGGYWWAFLANIIVSFVFSFVITLIGSRGATLYANSILITFTLICVPASLAIMVRRLRDAGNHWANVFWAFLPIVGTIILIIKLCQPTQSESAPLPSYITAPQLKAICPLILLPLPATKRLVAQLSKARVEAALRSLRSLPSHLISARVSAMYA